MKGTKKNPTSVRLPDDIKIWIKAKSKSNDRSENYEIVRILRERKQQEDTDSSKAA